MMLYRDLVTLKKAFRPNDNLHSFWELEENAHTQDLNYSELIRHFNSESVKLRQYPNYHNEHIASMLYYISKWFNSISKQSAMGNMAKQRSFTTDSLLIEKMFYIDLADWLLSTATSLDIQDCNTIVEYEKLLKYLKDVSIKQIISFKRYDIVSSEKTSNGEQIQAERNNAKATLKTLIIMLEEYISKVKELQEELNFNNLIENLQNQLLSFNSNILDAIYLQINTVDENETVLDVVEFVAPRDHNGKIKKTRQTKLGDWLYQILIFAGIRHNKFSLDANINISQINNFLAKEIPGYLGDQKIELTKKLIEEQVDFLQKFGNREFLLTASLGSEELKNKLINYSLKIRMQLRLILEIYCNVQNSIKASRTYENFGNEWIYGHEAGKSTLILLLNTTQDVVNDLNNIFREYWGSYFSIYNDFSDKKDAEKLAQHKPIVYIQCDIVGKIKNNKQSIDALIEKIKINAENFSSNSRKISQSKIYFMESVLHHCVHRNKTGLQEYQVVARELERLRSENSSAAVPPEYSPPEYSPPEYSHSYSASSAAYEESSVPPETERKHKKSSGIKKMFSTIKSSFTFSSRLPENRRKTESGRQPSHDSTKSAACPPPAEAYDDSDVFNCKSEKQPSASLAKSAAYSPPVEACDDSNETFPKEKLYTQPINVPSAEGLQVQRSSLTKSTIIIAPQAQSLIYNIVRLMHEDNTPQYKTIMSCPKEFYTNLQKEIYDTLLVQNEYLVDRSKFISFFHRISTSNTQEFTAFYKRVNGMMSFIYSDPDKKPSADTAKLLDMVLYHYIMTTFKKYNFFAYTLSIESQPLRIEQKDDKSYEVTYDPLMSAEANVVESMSIINHALQGHVQELTQSYSSLREECSKKDVLLTEKQNEIAAQQVLLEEKDKEILVTKFKLDETEKLKVSAEEKAREKDTVIAEKDRTIEEKDRSIEETRGELAEKNSSIVAQDKMLQAINEELLKSQRQIRELIERELQNNTNMKLFMRQLEARQTQENIFASSPTDAIEQELINNTRLSRNSMFSSNEPIQESRAIEPLRNLT